MAFLMDATGKLLGLEDKLGGGEGPGEGGGYEAGEEEREDEYGSLRGPGLGDNFNLKLTEE